MRFLRGKAGRDEQVGVGDGSGSDDSATRPQGKGRPTPRRRDAEPVKRGPAPPPPRTQKEASKRITGARAERRKQAKDERKAMAAGDERYLPPRDQGPEKALVRDYVDSHRSVLNYFMPLALVVLLVLFVPSSGAAAVVSFATMLMLLLLILEAFRLGRVVNEAVHAKYPKTEYGKRSLTFYAFGRATQIRRMRMPKPRVALGEWKD